MEEKLIDRIGDEYLNGNFQDGQILLNSDVNEIVSIVKEGINANFNDIQKIQNGSHQVGNSKQLDGADLSRFSDGEMVGSDKLIPTSQQVKSYVDGKVQEIKDTTEVGKLVEDLNELSINVDNKVDKKDLVNEETTGTDKAYNCDYINELFENGVGDSLPIGTIVEYTGDSIPDGFEEVIEPENATVYVGPTEPTDGQEVWIKPAKNLFNINATPNKTYYCVPTIEGDTLKTSGSSGNFIGYLINVKPNTDYTVSVASKTGSINVYDATIDNYIAGMGSNNNSLTFNSGSREQITLVFYGAGTYEKPQLEQGTIATSYEKFDDRRIFIKNNDVYEEFYKNNGIIESGSNDNGTYVKFADGRMECYGVLTLTNFDLQHTYEGVYYNYETINLPSIFVNSDYVVVEGCSSPKGLPTTRTNNKTTTSFDVTIENISKITFESIDVNYVAKGRWK